jgi:1,4-dihydroxy-2-naphthoyl-CoA hydrolase
MRGGGLLFTLRSLGLRILLRLSAALTANLCWSMTSPPERSGMPGHFGIRITDANKDKLVGELDADDRHLNNSGHVHGGALAAFADDLGGAVAALNVAPGFRTTTLESKTNIFRACPPGRLTGVAVPVHVGQRTIVLQTSIYHADGKLAAMMIQTQMVLARRSAKPTGEGSIGG